MFFGFLLSLGGLGPATEARAEAPHTAADPLGPSLARQVAELAGPPGHPLQIDAGLTRAAGRFVTLLGARQGEGTLEEARAMLRKEGLAEPQLIPYSAGGADRQQLAARLLAFAKDTARARGLTHLGVAQLEREGGSYLVAFFTRRLIYLQPFAEKERVGRLTIRGKARGSVEGLLVGPCPAPDEPCRKAVIALSVKRRGDGLSVVVPLPRDGLYLFELVVTTERGPEVGALWTFAVGVPPGAIGVDPVPAGPPTAEQLLTLVGDSRAKAEVGPLVVDPRLTRAAEAHAARICQSRIAAHVVDGQGPVERTKAEGYVGRLAENLAIAESLGRAHTQLMLSPGHRRNVLDPVSTLIGVGVIEHPASDGSMASVCVVELYGR